MTPRGKQSAVSERDSSPRSSTRCRPVRAGRQGHRTAAEAGSSRLDHRDLADYRDVSSNRSPQPWVASVIPVTR